MHRDRFRRLVHRALDSLPPEIDGYLDNVAIVIEREPTPEDLAHAASLAAASCSASTSAPRSRTAASTT